jgi:hypothetical protein
MCVEMDTGSAFSQYSNYIPELKDEYRQKLEVKHDLAKILSSQPSRRLLNGSPSAF